MVRNNWTLEEVETVYTKPLLDLVFEAASVHREYHNSQEVQVCSLINIKVGGCKENCAYCSQSAWNKTNVKAEPLMDKDEAVRLAKVAKDNGATRVCLGAAWREVRDSAQFDRVIEMVKEMTQLGVEVCCTLGMLTEPQAQRLADAGLYAYNHNLDTSREHYSYIVTTRTYDDRLKTIENVNKANISVCCGGILGMGEKQEDRIALLHTLATLPSHPDSVPINKLETIPGTPLENLPPLQPWELLRSIATARILMPKAMIRLSAGREKMSIQEQAFCFMAGANSVFSGEKLLTVDNIGFDEDRAMFDLLGITPRAPFKKAEELIHA